MKAFALAAAFILAQAGTGGNVTYTTNLPIVAKSRATWATVLQVQGKPFTDAVQIDGSLFISRQDGTIYRDGAVWMVLPVNSQGESGLNALAASGRNLWAAYISEANRITVAQILTTDKGIIPIADFGDAGTKHNAGGLHYTNGALLFGIGDNTDALSAQDDTKAGGKVWVIDTRTGDRSIAARGLRNPWHITTIGAHTYISDVGETKYEEVNAFTIGANYGWPCFEALEPRIYAPDVCDGLQWTTPALAYGRDVGHGIVGVAAFDGVLAYADFDGVVRMFAGAELRRMDRFISKMTPLRDGVALLSFAGGVARAEVWR